MKKNKIKIITIIVMFVALLMVNSVKAASISLSGSNTNSIKYGNGEQYQDYNFIVNIDGANYPGYCLDPSYTFHNSGGITCKPLTDNGPMNWLMQNLTGNHVVDQLAVRMVAIRTNLNKSAKGHGQFIVLYLQERLGGKTSTQLYGASEIDAAYNLHLQAMSNASSGSNSTAPVLTFMKANVNGNTITYNISSPANIPDASLAFTCEGCSVKKNSWNGTSGSITVTVENGNCSFKINAFYPSAGINICETPGQNIITSITGGAGGAVSTTGTPTQTFEGQVGSDSGDYYKKYCIDDDTCSSDCSSKVNMPEFCDEGMNDASITSPEDIKCCVLHGKDDAGNTYQMKDGQISNDNPYCAVYCKEDYQMKLPGAQHANSGRYFILENTVVTAQRSCYATSAPSKKKNGKQIDIDQFVKDVIQKQETLIKAFNTYQEWNARLESVKNPSRHNTDPVDCSYDYCRPTGNVVDTCGGNAYSKSEHQSCSIVHNDAHYGSTKSYKKANYSIDRTTGKVTITSISTPSLSDNYGFTLSCQSQSCGTDKSKVGTFETVAEYQSRRDSAEAAMTAALNDLKKTIEYMQECYSWVNNLCLDPEVLFDYEEDYPINYEKVGGTGPTSSAPTYSNQKDIDNAYTANGGGSLEDVNYAFCDKEGCNNSNAETLAKQISTLSSHLYYRKIDASGSAEYANTQEFYVKYPDGSVNTSDGSNYNPIGQVYPIALKRDTGLYKWTLNFSKLGQYNDFQGCKNGRLDDVVRALGKSTSTGLEYVCTYIVDCDECDYECVGPGCLIEDDPKCPECDVYCINCVFDGDEDTYFYRTVSVNDFNPNNRTLGANWTNAKGTATRDEIEKMAETVYEDVQYSYTITPTQMKNIRDYNGQTGTYVTEDLNFNHTKGDVTLAYGTSNFLRNTGRTYFTELKKNDTWELWTASTGDGIGPAWK